MDSLIRPPTRTVIAPEHHASRSIGKPYPKEDRELVLYLHDNYPEVLDSPATRAAQENYFHAAKITIRR